MGEALARFVDEVAEDRAALLSALQRPTISPSANSTASAIAQQAADAARSRIRRVRAAAAERVACGAINAAVASSAPATASTPEGRIAAARSARQPRSSPRPEQKAAVAQPAKADISHKAASRMIPVAGTSGDIRQRSRSCLLSAELAGRVRTPATFPVSASG